MGSTDAYSGSVQAKYDWSNIAPSIAVIDAIAALENVEPIDLSEKLDTTLFDHVDPEALDTLVTEERPLSVSFSIEEYLIRIDGSELVICHD